MLRHPALENSYQNAFLNNAKKSGYRKTGGASFAPPLFCQTYSRGWGGHSDGTGTPRVSFREDYQNLCSCDQKLL